MHLMTDTTARRRAGILTRMRAWIGQRQRELSDRVHAASDECARQHGWEVTKSTGRFGFGARSYRDPRFGDRCWQPGRQQTEGPTIGWTEASAYTETGGYEANREPGE
jgi:hypothetical protein